MSRSVLAALVALTLLLTATRQAPTLAAVNPLVLGINIVTSYTWIIQFNDSNPRTNITLVFPSVCKLFSNTTAYVGTTQVGAGNSSNSLIITHATLITGTVTIVVVSVQNPFSAMTVGSFTVTSTIGDSFSLDSSNSVTYSQGSLVSCSWSFSECTEQPNSKLTVTVVTGNPIPTGTNNFIIGYDTWPNLSSKSLLTGVAPLSLSSLVSFDSGTSWIACNSTDFNNVSQTVTITYTQNITVNASNTVMFRVIGVQSPPTQTTVASSSFYSYTADSSKNRIDSFSGVTINPICVLSLSSGIFSNSNMPVNSAYAGRNVVFVETPTITMMGSDTVQVYFTPFANLAGCTSMRIWRNGGNRMPLSFVQSNSYYTFSFDSMSANTEYSFNITLSLICSNITTTNSETPVPLTFKFKRSNSQYLELTAFMTPKATAIATSKLAISLNNSQMIATNAAYTMSVTTSQGLGNNPALLFTFDPDVLVPTIPTCTVGLLPGSSSPSSCKYNSSTQVLTVNFTATSAVGSGTAITVVVSGITNPTTPAPRIIGVATYYDQSVPTSKVEENTAAYSVPYTGITNYNATFFPDEMKVYTSRETTITLNNSILIPSGSTIYVSFPSQASGLAVTNTPLKIDTLDSNTAAPSIYQANNSFTLTTVGDIPANSLLEISSTITAPSSMGSFNYVVITISLGSTLYISSTTKMFLYVNSVVSMNADIIPKNSFTGAITGYTVTLSIIVPHPASFLVEFSLPSDVKFNGTGLACSGDCNNTSVTNSTQFSISAVNSRPGEVNFGLTFQLSAVFLNGRSKGKGMLWNITTKTISPSNTITYQQADPQIKFPNTLTAIFSPDDSYYKNNKNVVAMTFTFTNSLVEGDFILLSVKTTTYSQLTIVKCSPLYGACTKSSQSTADVLVVKILPNITSIINNTLVLLLEGVISGSEIEDSSIQVKSFNSTLSQIDSGGMTYSVSCMWNSAVTDNNCRTCYSNGSCLTCYTADGYYLNSTMCVTSCGGSTSFLSYNNNLTGKCTACINNCQTCTSAAVCRSCIPTYYFYPATQTCELTCPATYYTSYTDSGGTLKCGKCNDALCVQCSNTGYAACTTCQPGSLLMGGLCSNNCSSSTMYPSGGVCLPCNESCLTCISSGNGGCTRCNITFYNYSNFCVSTCPTGTAMSSNGNGTCTCDHPCSACTGTTTNCTACYNSSEFVSQGACVATCPLQTYKSGTTCMQCSTGCFNCSSNTCYSCLTDYYLYNNVCHSDCKLISPQYDKAGSNCVLCPDGCSTCQGVTCTSCLSNYTLQVSSSQCIQTCLINNNCEISASQVLPMPGLIALVVWCIVVGIIKFIMQKNYVPYSLILFTSIIQYVLVIATIATATSIPSAFSRLLASTAQRSTVRILLGVSLAVNYISNFVYIYIFIKYIKPLITNPRQIDMISNVVVLVIATITNYRFAIIAFSRLFPKPNIYVENGSKLTPVHYLAIASILMDVIPIAACGLGVYNQQPLSNLFMLCMDLLIVIAINVVITIWFVSCSKPESYYEDYVKKYHLEEKHGPTDETLPNEKNISQEHMIANDTFNSAEEENSESAVHDTNSYKKFEASMSKVKVKGADSSKNTKRFNVNDDAIAKNDITDIDIDAMSNSNNDNAFHDVNFEPGLKHRQSSSIHSRRTALHKQDHKQEMAVTMRSDGKSVEDGLGSKQKSHPNNFSKQSIPTNRKTYVRAEKDIQEAEEDDLPDLDEESNNEGRGKVFEKPKEKLAKPKRVGTEKKLMKKQVTKSTDQPLKILKKEKVGYFESDAFESNAEQDIESIIKQKVWQSTIKVERPKETVTEQNNHSEVAYDEVSPSWFNIQNQRVELSDFDERESHE